MRKKLAVGGMGAIYRSEIQGGYGFKKTVAVKMIKKERLLTEHSRVLFVNEANIVSGLEHQNIVQVHYLAEANGLIMIVMEYVHGVSLSQVIKRLRFLDKQFDPEMAALIASRVCRGLQYAHTKCNKKGRPLGIVHRDVSPGNILIDLEGAVKLTDFGIAKALNSEAVSECEVLMGKYPYMSYEHISCTGTDARADIYSLGLVLHEMLTGKIVFKAKTKEEQIEKLNTGRIASPKEIRSDLPEPLCAIIKNAIYKDRDLRYKTAQDFSTALEHFMYHDHFGPTTEKLGEYIRSLFPDVEQEEY